jgi:hypothetical protein
LVGAVRIDLLSVLQLLMRPTFSMRIFGEIDVAVDWLTFTLVAHGATPSAATLSRTVRELSTPTLLG